MCENTIQVLWCYTDFRPNLNTVGLSWRMPIALYTGCKTHSGYTPIISQATWASFVAVATDHICGPLLPPWKLGERNSDTRCRKTSKYARIWRATTTPNPKHVTVGPKDGHKGITNANLKGQGPRGRHRLVFAVTIVYNGPLEMKVST